MTWLKFTAFVVIPLFVAGCETVYTREVTFTATGLNHQPDILVDTSRIPIDKITKTSQSGQIGATGNAKTSYFLSVPVRVIVVPHEEGRGE